MFIFQYFHQILKKLLFSKRKDGSISIYHYVDPWKRRGSPGSDNDNDNSNSKEGFFRGMNVKNNGGEPFMKFLEKIGPKRFAFLCLIFFVLAYSLIPSRNNSPIGSWYIIDEGSTGILMRWGKVINDSVPPGLHFKFPFMDRYISVNTSLIRVSEIGAKYSSKLVTPSGSVPRLDAKKSVMEGNDKIPVRLKNQANYMLTNDKNVVDLDFTVQWKVSSPVDFALRTYSPIILVNATIESVMREVIGANGLEYIITVGRKDIEDKVLEQAQQIMNKYETGVTLLQVQLQKADPPDKVIDAFRDVVNAAQDAEKMINKSNQYYNQVVPAARGEAEKILQDSEAYKYRKIAQARGDTKRFLSIYYSYKKDPDILRHKIFMESMSDVLYNVDKVLIDPSVAGSFIQHMFMNRTEKNSQDIVSDKILEVSKNDNSSKDTVKRKRNNFVSKVENKVSGVFKKEGSN